MGAGLAGLLCTRSLQRRGIDTLLLEAESGPGGRVRTDVIDGFRCDRGFQLLNPAYPALARHVDVAALDLRTFGRGVDVVRDSGVSTLTDPLTRPSTIARSLRSGYANPIELARLARWLAPSLGPVPRLLAGSDESLADSWAGARITGRLRTEVLEPFLAGVLADDSGATSATFVRLLMRSFLRATPGIPALGMQSLPEQLAALPGRPLRTGVRVTSVRRTSFGHEVLSAEGVLRPRAVVVATDAAAATELLGLGVHRMHGLRTFWFTCPEPPTGSDLLRIDAGGSSAGPVLNTAVMTNVAPTYAPPGRHLVQATTLLPSAAEEHDVRRHLDRLYATSTREWELVVRHDIDRALPAVLPPLQIRQEVTVGDGVFVTGDHRDTSSLQGALASGARTALAVQRQLSGVLR